MKLSHGLLYAGLLFGRTIAEELTADKVEADIKQDK